MIALRIFVNGKLLYTAGVGDCAVPYLGTHVSAGGPDETRLELTTQRVADLASLDLETWPTERLAIGDEIKIQVIDANAIDPPTGRRPIAQTN